jgi:hypothetical protein
MPSPIWADQKTSASSFQASRGISMRHLPDSCFVL